MYAQMYEYIFKYKCINTRISKQKMYCVFVCTCRGIQAIQYV